MFEQASNPLKPQAMKDLLTEPVFEVQQGFSPISLDSHTAIAKKPNAMCMYIACGCIYPSLYQFVKGFFLVWMGYQAALTDFPKLTSEEGRRGGLHPTSFSDIDQNLSTDANKILTNSGHFT